MIRKGLIRLDFWHLDLGSNQGPYGLIVCTQSSQGSTSQPQSAQSLTDFAGVLAGVGGENFGFVICGAPPDTSMAASMFGIQRENGVRSATSTMYQHFLAASQRPPRALTASFSAKGVTKLILMRRIIRAWFAVAWRATSMSKQVRNTPGRVPNQQPCTIRHPVQPIAMPPAAEVLRHFNGDAEYHQTQHHEARLSCIAHQPEVGQCCKPQCMLGLVPKVEG